MPPLFIPSRYESRHRNPVSLLHANITNIRKIHPPTIPPLHLSKTPSFAPLSHENYDSTSYLSLSLSSRIKTKNRDQVSIEWFQKREKNRRTDLLIVSKWRRTEEKTRGSIGSKNTCIILGKVARLKDKEIWPVLGTKGMHTRVIYDPLARNKCLATQYSILVSLRTTTTTNDRKER